MGSASIKLVEVEQTTSPPPRLRRGPPEARLAGSAKGVTGVRLVHQVLQELPPGAAADPHARLSWLQAVMKESRSPQVHLALGSPEVVIRTVRIPPMSKEELAEAVKWHVKDLLPFPVAEAVLDFEVLEEVWEKDIKKLHVVVAAAPLRIVQEQLAMMAQAGATVASILPTTLAIRRTLQLLSPTLLGSSVAILEVGAAQTHVVILKDGQPQLAREVPIGSAAITDALVGVSAEGGEALDAAQAEHFKRHHGILAEDSQLAALMRVVVDTLMTDLRRILDFYHVHLQESGVERLLVVGGGANLKHLPAVLREGLGLPVECYHPPLAGLPAGQAGEEDGPRLTAAIGAALAHGQGLNLLPEELKTRRRQASSRERWRRMGILAGGVAVGLYGLLLLAAWRDGRRLQDLQREWRTFEPSYRRAREITDQTARIDAITAALGHFRSRQPVWEGIFKELSRVTPPGAALTDGLMTRRDLTLRGTVSAGGSAEAGALARFLEALDSSIFFRRARLRSSQVEGAGRVSTFEIVAELE